MVMSEIKQLEWRKKKWPNILCIECKHYLDEVACRHCIRYQGRKDKWVAIPGVIAHPVQKEVKK